MSYWENLITEEQYVFLQTQYLILCPFSTNCVHSVLYFASLTNWDNKIQNTFSLQTLSVQIHILGSGLYMMNFKVLLKWYHKRNCTLKITSYAKGHRNNKCTLETDFGTHWLDCIIWDSGSPGHSSLNANWSAPSLVHNTAVLYIMDNNFLWKCLSDC